MFPLPPLVGMPMVVIRVRGSCDYITPRSSTSRGASNRPLRIVWDPNEEAHPRQKRTRGEGGDEDIAGCQAQDGRRTQMKWNEGNKNVKVKATDGEASV